MCILIIEYLFGIWFAKPRAAHPLSVHVYVCLKHMVTGRAVEEGDQEPISLEGGSIEAVKELQHLRLLMVKTGKMDSDVSRRLAPASKLLEH